MNLVDVSLLRVVPLTGRVPNLSNFVVKHFGPLHVYPEFRRFQSVGL